VVDEDVDAPELRARPVHHVAQVARRGDVGGDGDGPAAHGRDLLGGALGPGGIQLGDGDVGTQAGELEGGGAADAAAPAGDDGGLSCQLHWCPPRGQRRGAASSRSAGVVRRRPLHLEDVVDVGVEVAGEAADRTQPAHVEAAGGGVVEVVADVEVDDL